MIPLEALKKRAKQQGLQKLIDIMRGLEAKEPDADPLAAHQNQEDKVLDQMEHVIEPDYDEGHLPKLASEPDPEAEDEAGDFHKEMAGFMKRSGKNPPVKGKSRMLVMAAEARPGKAGAFRKMQKGY